MTNQSKTPAIGLDQVKAIAPYVGGRPISAVAREFGLVEDQIIKLASNENPLGIPESAKRAMADAIADLGRYPDSNGFELKVFSASVKPRFIKLLNLFNDSG